MPTRLLIALLGLLLVPTVASTRTSQTQWIAYNRAGAPSESLQCFTPGNIAVTGGNLIITTKAGSARCSSFDLAPATHPYTSGFVAMRSFEFLYGVVEVRARFSGGEGTGAWPVIWMADASCHASDPGGTDNRCNGQEIDIAEILKSEFTHVNQQIHVDNFTHNDGCTASTTDTSRSFHVYRIDWSPGSLVFSIDGTVTCTIAQKYVPSAPMYLKINVFAGGYGGPVNNGSLPWTTLIDSVKVSQGSSVVFNDDFNQSDTIEAAEFSTVTPSAWRTLGSSLGVLWSKWPVRLAAIGLSIVAVTASIRFLGQK